jgi:hypothetical protein
MTRHIVSPPVPVSIVASNPAAVAIIAVVMIIPPMMDDDDGACLRRGRCQTGEAHYTAQEKHKVTFHKGWFSINVVAALVSWREHHLYGG